MTAEDAAGNVSGLSPEASATVGDSSVPTAPGTLNAVGSVGRATLTWGAATDNVGVVRYNVHRGTSAGFTPAVGNRIAQPTGTGYTDLTSPGSYFYKVTAEDAAGNIGAASNEAEATVTADTNAPSTPAGLAGSVVGGNVNLSWSASTDDVGVVRYNVHRATSAGFTPSAGNRIAQPTATNYADTGLATGSYFYKVTAEDAAGNISAASNEATATIADATAPSAPGTLAAAVAGSNVNLSWGAATDNVGVSRYNLHRGTTSGFTPAAGNRIAQPTGLSYADNGLAPGSYFYKLTAEDAAGNIGAVSNTATAAVLDSSPPTTPANLAATGGAGQASLTWAAATDNVGVSRYNLHRGTSAGFTPTVGNRIAQPTTTSYTDTGLAAGTYYYRVTAEDAATNTSPASNEATATVTAPAVTGLVAAYGFDNGTGTTTPDQSGNNNNGTLTNATWAGPTTGKYGNALSFNGTNAWVTVPDSNSLDLTTGMTLEAWVRPNSVVNYRTLILKERPGELVYGVYSSTDTGRPSANATIAGSSRELVGTSAIPVAAWTHLAVTYDGATLRLFVNGTQASQLAAAGAMPTSTSPLRIGGNAVWAEWFNGLIDEVRIYSRALSAGEIQTDMNRSVTPDTTRPTVLARTPTPGAAGLPVSTSATARFSEAMNPATITSSTFELRDPANVAIPTNVTYNAATTTATVTPQAALEYGTTYTVVLRGGAGGVADTAGNQLLADSTWTFSTEASPPPILLVGSSTNAFTMYLGEILRNEGLNAFTTLDVAFISPALLAQFDVVVLGETALSAAQESTLTGWVDGGGNLIAMRPSTQLSSLLGLTSAGTTLANTYLQVDTGTPAGTGIVGQTIQFHGTADRYNLNGATAIATLYSNATTATTNPAVTLRSVGSNGGQAAAFTYDLARSVVYTRQGNPAWVGQNRDGFEGISPDDLFYGARAGDVQPDWIDTNKIAIPQADEQQRLLLNLITQMARDRLPLPRFWYLPRGEKAAVVMSADDHSAAQAPGGTAFRFDRYKALSPAGCVVSTWDCVRATSYIYPRAPSRARRPPPTTPRASSWGCIR